jgi:hypothetical protein
MSTFQSIPNPGVVLHKIRESQDESAWEEILRNLSITSLQRRNISLWSLSECREMVNKAFLHTPLPHAIPVAYMLCYLGGWQQGEKEDAVQ